MALYLNNLARVLKATGAYGEAEALYRETVALQRQFLGEAHPDLAKSLSNLATLLTTLGDSAEAEALLWEALAIKLGGSTQRKSTNSCRNASLDGKVYFASSGASSAAANVPDLSSSRRAHETANR